MTWFLVEMYYEEFLGYALLNEVARSTFLVCLTEGGENRAAGVARDALGELEIAVMFSCILVTKHVPPPTARALSFHDLQEVLIRHKITNGMMEMPYTATGDLVILLETGPATAADRTEK